MQVKELAAGLAEFNSITILEFLEDLLSVENIMELAKELGISYNSFYYPVS